MKSTQILSQRIDCLTPQSIDAFIEESVKKKRKKLIFAMNVHILVELSKNLHFKKIHNTADLIFADGVPLIWMSQFAKHPLPCRVSGTDLVERILQNTKYKVFVLGSTEEVLTHLVNKYSKNIVGKFSPPFGKLWDAQIDKKIIQLINRSNANILLVGVGPLKQEKWLLHHFPQTNANVGIGVGSAFDILSGKTPRAPQFMKDKGLESLWRVRLEPRRLWRRYLTDFFVMMSIIRMRLFEYLKIGTKRSNLIFHFGFMTLILLIALYIRFYHFSFRLEWNPDSARDYVVGYLLKTTDQKLTVGHSASGNSFYYPPYYYYLLASLMIVNTDPKWIYAVLSVLNISILCVFYYLGKQNGKWGGFLSCLIFLFSQFASGIGHEFHAIVFASSLFMWGVLFLFSGWDSKKIIQTSLGIFLISFSAYFSYLYGLLLPLAIVFLFLERKFTIKKKIIIFVMSCIINVLLLSPLLFVFGLIPTISRLFTIQSGRHVIELSRINDYISHFREVLFYFSNSVRFLSVMVLSLLLLLIHLYTKTFSKKMLLLILYLSLSILCSLIVEVWYSHWTIPSVLVFHLLIGLSASQLLKTKDNLIKVLGLTFYGIIVFFLSSRLEYLHLENHSLEKYTDLAEHVKATFEPVNNKSFFIVSRSTNSWQSTRLWYHLLGDQSLKLIDSGENLIHDTNTERKICICDTRDEICDDRLFELFTEQKVSINIDYFATYKLFTCDKNI